MDRLIHPLTKIVLVASLAICAFTVQSVTALLELLAVSALLMILPLGAGRDTKRLIRQMFRLLPVFVSLFILQLLFNRQGSIIWKAGFIAVYDKALQIALFVTLRLMILVCSGAFIWNLTVRQLLTAFRSLGISETFTVMLLMTLRFLPVLTAQIRQSVQQLKMRNIHLNRLGIWHRLQILKNLLVPVLGWTIKDLQYQAISLDMRGFRNGITHTRHKHRKLQISDFFQLGIILAGAFLFSLLQQS